MENNRKDRVSSPGELTSDKPFELSLRPANLAEFIGQRTLCENLAVYIEAARKRSEPLDHTLLYGPPGLGKTTIAKIIANELQVDFISTSGPVIERAGDLAGILTKLSRGDVLFIDEVHRLSPVVEEYLYPAMEDFNLDIVIDRGPHSRSVKLNLEPFTLIGATTRAGLLTPPMRARFGVLERISFYDSVDLQKIVHRTAELLGISITSEGASEIARRSRGTPRVANRLLRRVRDFALVGGHESIDKDNADFALTRLEVDDQGLDKMDKTILRTIAELFGKGPVGIQSLAVAVGEERETIEEVYEPYLIMEGFLVRTSRGRRITARGLAHLGLESEGTPTEQQDLF